MNKDRILGQYTTVAVASAALVFLLYWSVQSLIPTKPNGILLKGLTGTGAYFILFKVLLWVYSKILWKLRNHNYYIGGNWDYSYDVYGKDGGVERENRPGHAYIIHTMDSMRIFAESGDPMSNTDSSSVKTLWYTTSASTDENRIWAGLEFSNERGAGHGFIILHVKNPGFYPTKLDGHYFFLEGSEFSRGRVTFRKKAKQKHKSLPKNR